MTSSLLIFFFLAVLCAPLSAESTRYNYIDASRFNLRGNQTDLCYSEKTLKAQAECLQSLIEFYYGRYFTRSCPDFPLVLAVWNCRECPWSRLNMSSIPTLNETDVLVFPGTIKPSCAVARHVSVYKTYWNTVNRVMGFAVIGSLMLAFCIGLLAMNDKNEIPSGIQVFWCHIPEPLFLLLIWIVADFGLIFLIASQDHIQVCDNITTVLTLQVADGLSYTAILYLTMRRCFFMKATHIPEEYLSSWSSFLWADADELSSPQRKRRIFFRFCYLFVPVLLIIAFALDYFYDPILGEHINEESQCLLGSIRYTNFGFVQYSKLALETLAVFIYAFGPSETQWRFYTRYCFLWLTSILCFIILTLQFDPRVYNKSSVSTTIPRVLDSVVSGRFIELTYAIVITLMGILEPLRIGWPKLSKHDD